ncbi:MAG TPA: IS1595 family transposase [Stellaceae bacterium]|nr:IS1595 family transposase [Stellaceae bacterium]
MLSHLNAPYFHNEEAARAVVEAHLWPNGPVCPFCGEQERIGELKGKTTRAGLRKCYACKKPFTVKIGTVLQESNIPYRYWLQAIYLLCASKKGMSTRQLQRTLGCGMKTAWHLSHRVRKMMEDTDPTPMGGEGKIVESDETFYMDKADIPEPWRFTNEKGWQKRRPGPSNKLAILTLVERGGKARSVQVPDLKTVTLAKIILGRVDPASTFMTDERMAYRRIGKRFAEHEFVTHNDEEYARGRAHVNSAEGFFSVFKRGMVGVYQHCEEQHLHRYLAEFDFRYSNREKLGVDDAERASRALKGAKGKRLPYGSTR